MAKAPAVPATEEPVWRKDEILPVEAMLAEREVRYGSFEEHALISQNIKDAMRCCEGWGELNSYQVESLEMIAHKIARILNGDPNYIDNWVDIVGYSQLAVNILNEDAQA